MSERSDAVLREARTVDRAVDVVLVVLVAAGAGRYLVGHGLADAAGWVLAGAGGLVAAYLLRHRLRPAARVPWLAVVCLLWAGLVLVAPSFGWAAVPLAVAALRVLPYRVAVVVVGLLAALVSATWVRMGGRFDPAVIVGPASVAVLAVGAFRALERAAAARQALVDDLRSAQAELAAAQRAAGALGERARLAREIHDSVAQDLSSINLLLQAAEQDWPSAPERARELVRRAAGTARDGLVEARRVVQDLAPPVLDGGGLAAALARLAEDTEQEWRGTTGPGEPGDPPAVRVTVVGPPVPVPEPVQAALLRTARGALANVREHARARTAVLTLTYEPGAVRLDVYDDGRGFAVPPGPARPGPAGRGFGLPGIAARVAELGGRLDVESTPGEGTALAVTIPTGGRGGRGGRGG